MFGFGLRKKTPLPRFNVVFVSEVGLVRTDNQDNVFVSPNHGVFCVADGIGGCAAGAVASGLVCAEVRRMLQISEESIAARTSSLERAVVSANAAIRTYAEDHKLGRMGSTVAAMAFDLDDRSRAGIVHVGDSRVYRVRGGMAQQLTRDHRDRDSNALTRAIGADPTVRSEVAWIDVRPGDRFVICTDGVHGVVPATRLAVFAGGGSVETAAERLADAVVKAGAPDNYSFIIVEVV